MDNFALQQIISRIPLVKFRYLGSFPSDYDPTLDNDTFVIINTQLSNMQGEHWIMISKFRHELYFADSLGCKGHSFLNQHYKQMILLLVVLKRDNTKSMMSNQSDQYLPKPFSDNKRQIFPLSQCFFSSYDSIALRECVVVSVYLLESPLDFYQADDLHHVALRTKTVQLTIDTTATRLSSFTLQ